MRRARTSSAAPSPADSVDLEHVLDRDLVRLLALVDGAREALLCLAADGAVLHLNPAAEELFGVHALEVLGRAWHEHLPAWLAPALAPHEPPAKESAGDGEARWWVSTLRGEHELRRRELSAGERLVFVSPVVPRAPGAEAPSWEAVHRAPRSAERFAEWTELAAGEAIAHPAAFALGPALGGRPLRWEAEARARGLVFRARFDPLALLAPLAGAARHAVRAIEELVDNALRFTPSGGSVELCVESEAAGLAVRVRNTGDGLGPGEWERARAAFARLSDPLDGTPAGPGLGLALVDAHLERLAARPFARRDAERGEPTFSVSFHLLAAVLEEPRCVEPAAAIG